MEFRLDEGAKRDPEDRGAGPGTAPMLRTPEFDPEITAQEIKVQSAEATYQNARLTREVSEIAVMEYEQGIYLSGGCHG